MIRFQCQCGAGHSVQASVAAQISRCPVCQAPLRLVFGGPPPAEAECTARLIARDGSIPKGLELLLGGVLPIEVGKLAGKHLLLPGTLISRNHCRLVPGPSGWTLVDEGSTNGSYINSIRVMKHELADGDSITLGEHEFEFREANAIGPIASDLGRALPAATHAEEKAGSARPTAIPAEEEPFAGFDTYDEPIPIDTEPAEIDNPIPFRVDIGHGRGLIHDGLLPIREEPPEPASPSGPAVPDDNPLDPADQGSYDIAPSPIERPRRVEQRPFAVPAPDQFPAPVAAPRKAPLPTPQCPACNRTLTPGAKICVQCGVDVRTGRPIITAQGLDEDHLYHYAETLVGIISWIFPFGLYPIASEAYGTLKPYAIWGIALLTILTSVAFWVGADDPRGPGRQLELWAGEVSPELVRSLYTDEGVDATDQMAYEKKVAELRGTVPDQQLPVAAYQALPAEHQVFGHFELYQLLSCAFIHGGVMHLAGNLLFLLVFGSRVNALIGQWKTVALYPLLAVVSAGAYCIAEIGSNPMACVGASGAIMGLAGLYLVLFPVHRVHNVIWFRISPLFAPFLMLRVWAASGGESGLLRAWMKLFALRGFWVVLFYISFDVFYTAFHIHDQVAHWAHLGGFLGGMAVGIILLMTRAVDARGGDLISVVLGKYAWSLLGKPGHRSGANAGAASLQTAP